MNSTIGGRAGAAAQRYVSLDVLRAFALVSMVSYHVTDGDRRTIVGKVLHSAIWIDGAFFFVALSGVVTGLVHRRVIERDGLPASRAKLVKRSAVLYAVQLALVALVISVNTADPNHPISATPVWDAGPGFLRTAFGVLTLSTHPDFVDVLPMYVFFLLGAIVAVHLLAERRFGWVVAVSGAIYLAGHVLGGHHLAPGGTFDLTGWQLLFVGGLLVGWTWEHERLDLGRHLRQRLIFAAALVSAACFLLARFERDLVFQLPGAPVDKMSGGIIAFMFAGAVLVVGYAAVERLRQVPRLRPALSVVAVAGSKGLPGYVMMVLCVLVLQLGPAVPRDDAVIAAVAIACGLAELAALKLGARRVAARTRPTVSARPPTAVGSRVTARSDEAISLYRFESRSDVTGIDV